MSGSWGPQGGIAAASVPLLFGDGSDGDVTISSAVSLTKDMNYRNLTITGAGQLQAAGFIVRVSNLLELAPATTAGAMYNRAGGFSNTALNTGNAGSGATGGAAQNNSVTSTGSLPATAALATAGANGGTGAGTNATAVSSLTWSPCVITNLAGGAGGAGSGGAGGAGVAQAVSADRPAFRNGVLSNLYATSSILLGVNAINTWMSIASANSGSSGGGDGTNSGGGGGAGGNAPSALFIFANIINRGASTAAGAINIQGMKGGAGGTAPTGNCGGGGGGGGAAGGLVWIITSRLTGATATGCINISGSDGGAGGNGVGTGVGGQGGGGGSTGVCAIRVIGSPVVITAPATAGAAGGLGSGTAGGSAGVGAVRMVDL